MPNLNYFLDEGSRKMVIFSCDNIQFAECRSELESMNKMSYLLTRVITNGHIVEIRALEKESRLCVRYRSTSRSYQCFFRLPSQSFWPSLKCFFLIKRTKEYLFSCMDLKTNNIDLSLKFIIFVCEIYFIINLCCNG